MLLFFCLLFPLGLFFVGGRALINRGYPLFGGRESFSWGARLSGGILMAPLVIVIVFFAVSLSTGFITFTAHGATDNVVYAYVVTIVSTTLGFLMSYVLAEMTYVPYWVISRQEERKLQSEGEDEEELSERERKKRKAKLEKKLARAREREETKQREREEEVERMTRRQEEARKRQGPPPMPMRDDDDA